METFHENLEEKDETLPEEERAIESAGEREHPLIEEEAAMVMEKAAGEESEVRGFLSRLPKGARKYLQIIALGSALTGAFELGIRPDEAAAEEGYEYVHKGKSAQQIYDEEYARARGQYERQYDTNEGQQIRETARRDAERDAMMSNIGAIAKRAYDQQIQAGEQRQINEIRTAAEREGRRRGYIDANRPRPGTIAYWFLNMVNRPNEIVTEAVDGK